MNRSIAALALLVVFGLIGLFLFALGTLLQINMLGREAVTPTGHAGVYLMFGGPVLCAAAALFALLLARARSLRIWAIVQMLAGAALALSAVSAISITHDVELRRQKLEALRDHENHSLEQAYRKVLGMAAEDPAPRVYIAARYDARQGSIVDGFLIGADAPFELGQVTASTGSVIRLEWVREDRFGPMPTNASTNVSAVRRFLLLISKCDDAIALKTPYGDAPLPAVEPQPVGLADIPVLRDQLTSDVLEMLSSASG